MRKTTKQKYQFVSILVNNILEAPRGGGGGGSLLPAP